jgi:hypothetical protein
MRIIATLGYMTFALIAGNLPANAGSPGVTGAPTAGSKCKIVKVKGLGGIEISKIDCGYGVSCENDERCCYYGTQVDCCKPWEKCVVGTCQP